MKERVNRVDIGDIGMEKGNNETMTVQEIFKQNRTPLDVMVRKPT